MAGNVPPLTGFSAGCIVLDACCLINLSVSGRASEIVGALGVPVAVVDYVLEQEALTVQEELWKGIVQTVSLQNEAEENAFVDFAVYLDDGEALTCAIAQARGWAVASDDRKVGTLLRQNFPHVQLVTTPELVKQWADRETPGDAELRSVLESIQDEARYFPGVGHPLYGWWRQSLAAT